MGGLRAESAGRRFLTLDAFSYKENAKGIGKKRVGKLACLGFSSLTCFFFSFSLIS